MITDTLEFQKYCWIKLYDKVEFILLPLGGNYDSHFDNIVTNVINNNYCLLPNEIEKEFIWTAKQYVDYVIKTYYNVD